MPPVPWGAFCRRAPGEGWYPHDVFPVPRVVTFIQRERACIEFPFHEEVGMSRTIRKITGADGDTTPSCS